MLFWTIIPLLFTQGTLASLVKREPVSWSADQCQELPLLSGIQVSSVHLECGKISVPLDYANTSKGTISLQMIRRLASQQPSKGGIFFSSAQEGTRDLFGLGDFLVTKLGADWDLVSWDIRGFGASESVLQDLTSDERNQTWGQITHPGQFESHGNLTVDADAEFFRTQAPIIDQGLQKFDEILKNKNGANLTYIGTAANVRDIVTMADTLYGSDKDINFYGLSTGSYMGMVLTQMFPNRIGKVILDGVVDPQGISQYIPILGLDKSIGDMSETLRGYFNACALAGPTQCSVARQNSTAEDIKGAINQLLNTGFKNWNNGQGSWSYNALATIVYSTLGSPIQWDSISKFLETYANTNTSTPATKEYSESLTERSYLSSIWRPRSVRSLAKRQQQDTPAVQIGFSSPDTYDLIANGCADAPDIDSNIVTTERVFEETIRVARTVTPFAASMVGTAQYCHRYTSRAVERYSGPWNVQPKNVVLIIGTQVDPFTPFRDAQFVTKLLGSKARLVQQAGYGHTTFALDSSCTADTLKKYMQGTIPDDKGNDGPDVVCQTDQGPFGLPANTPWNITTSQDGDRLTSGPSDPGLVNFPGLNPPAVATTSANQNGGIITRTFGRWSVILLTGLAVVLPFV